jgi:hypothetical protein
MLQETKCDDRNLEERAGLVVLTTEMMETTVSWDIKLCSPLKLRRVSSSESNKLGKTLA